MEEITWLDCETTSTDTNTGKIIQLAAFKTDMQFNQTTEVVTVLINPSCPIPAESTEVNGITDEMVANSPLFKEVAPGLFNFIGNSHIAGYNVTFDILMLMSEFSRCGITFNMKGRMIIDPLVTLRAKEPRDQSTVYTYYTGKILEGAHDAKADILATHEIAISQVRKYDGLETPADMYALSEPEKMCDLSRKIVMKDGVPVFNIKPHIGKPISEQIGFLQWMLGKDFPQDTKDWIQNYLATYKS